ncbi:MAG TPA: S46 family peptidase [Longimicrobiales bacterium]
MTLARCPISRALPTLMPVLALAVAACGGRAEPATPAPATAATTAETGDPLEPTPAARRTAERVTLTGTELGTMWTFENPPLEYWRERYGFEATQQWLDHVRLASVRYGEICSASFVSPDGLVLTNHHCARECIEAVSTDQHDYVVEGYYAPTRDRELLCPDLFLDQLVQIDDVTSRIQGVAPAGTDPAAAARAREAEIEMVQDECERTTDFECQVVSLYHGGQYKLYRYRRFQPVKLVFAPELQAGYFGGDLDNFTYPRYALDVAFVRAYQPDGRTPARTPNYFRWDPDGAREGELVFITGNPGSTSRQITLAQLLYEQQYRHPFLIQFLEGERDFLRWIASTSPEAERQVRDQLFGIENSIKAYSGQYAGLRDTVLVGTKIRWEREFRSRVEADPELRARYGSTWDEIEQIQREKLYVSPRLNINNWEFLGDPYSQLAGTLVRYVRETARPEAERLEGYRAQEITQVEQTLRRASPVDPEVGARTLAIRLDLARRWLPPDDPFIRLAFRPGENPRQAAERLVRSTRIADVQFREALIQGGTAAVEASDDPMVRLGVHMDDALRTLQPRWDALTAREAAQQERLAHALFATYGTRLPPDATFTLRISDGTVQGYPYNGTVAPAITSFYGIYERAYNFDNAMPFTLPRSFAERRAHVDLATPFDFVTTNDITGGNSGSPLIDREARIVGVAFDSNIEGLPNEFLFRTDTGARAVGVHSAGILMALRDIYQAEALVEELTGR